MAKAKKWFSFSYAKPRGWVRKHEQAIIKSARYGGFMAGFGGGAIGALATRQPAIWLGGVYGGTLGGDILGRKLVSSLETRLPSRMAFKTPRIRMPSARQVIAAPITIPFRIGETYGEAWVKHRRIAAKQITFVPARKNPFTPRKNIFTG